MIASLRGILLEKGTGHCVIEAGGVGYHVTVSTHTARALSEAGEPVFLLAHQVVREDALMLFGFEDQDERRLFELLISVSGVGPKVAIAVLSGLKSADLARAIRDENIAALVSVPGVGRKTAERLVVELRDKLDLVVQATRAPATSGTGVLPRTEIFDDAVAALVRLGYSQQQAVQAIRKVAGEGGDPTLEDLVRRVLAVHGRQTAGAR